MSVGDGGLSKHLDVLKACSLFEGLTADQIESIAGEMDVFTTPRGRLMMQHGDTTSEVFFLLFGRAIGQLIAGNGRQILFTEIKSGHYFGELAALDGAPRSITISANSDCAVATLSRAKFHNVLMQYPQVGINLATELGARLRGMNERLFGLVMHDVEKRVATRLMQLAQSHEQLIEGGEIADAPTHEVMANFVGSNREAVSRSMARMNKAGIISSDRKKVVIRALDRLLSLAEDEPD